MKAYKLPNGNFMVPKRAEGENGELGDGMVEVPPSDPEAQSWVAWYDRLGEDVPVASAPQPRPPISR